MQYTDVYIASLSLYIYLFELGFAFLVPTFMHWTSTENKNKKKKYWLTHYIEKTTDEENLNFTFVRRK